MTLQSDSQLQGYTARPNGTSNPSASGVQRSLTQALGQVSEILKERFNRVQTSAKPWADGAGRNLGGFGKQAVAQVRRRPLATTAAVIGLGVGLALLLSGRARAGASSVGAHARDAYRRYRR